MPSSGLHTNGYSLARRIVFDRLGLDVARTSTRWARRWARRCSRRTGRYLPLVAPLLGDGRDQGMAHITGGGITDNLPRVLPAGTAAEIDRRAWTVPPLFDWLVTSGDVPRDDAYRTFNMGMGLLARRRGRATAPGVLTRLDSRGEAGRAGDRANRRRRRRRYRAARAGAGPAGWRG